MSARKPKSKRGEPASERSGVHSKPSDAFTAEEAGTTPSIKSEPAPAAEPPKNPFSYDRGDYTGSRLVVGHEDEASIPALFAAALAPCESADSFAYGVLQQISAELSVLDYVREQGDLNERIVQSFAYAIEERARVAAEVVRRMLEAKR